MTSSLSSIEVIEFKIDPLNLKFEALRYSNDAHLNKPMNIPRLGLLQELLRGLWGAAGNVRHQCYAGLFGKK